MAPLKAGDLRQVLKTQNATWTVAPHLKDTDLIVEHPLGAVPPAGLLKANQIGKVDLKPLLKMAPGNPFLAQRRVSMKLLDATQINTRQTNLSTGGTIPLAGSVVLPAIPGAPSELLATTRAAAVDWRNRWGIPWITTTQDQGPCGSCWAFAATGVLESMVRIEHCVWSKRSEGDLHDGMGMKCANGGWPSTALDWVKINGIADPDCYPYTTNDPPYHPTADRSGRTERIADYVTIGDVEQQKLWLDTVGPLTACFAVYNDFFGYSGGIYRQTSTTLAGYHAVMVVGYDDIGKYWIIKNSWGQGWGEKDYRGQGGYARIAYGEVEIDSFAKYGVHDTNPDPWIKRRLHSGSMIESGNGAIHRNFELTAMDTGNQIRHWMRNGSDFGWQLDTTFANDAADFPTMIASTYNRNLEIVYRTTSNRLHHWYLDQTTVQWKDGGIFGPNDVAGTPGFIQSNYGAPGNFEVVVRTADGKLNLWYRDNNGARNWIDGGRFANNVALSGPTLVQSNFGHTGNFELVLVRPDGKMQHWWRDNDGGRVWHEGPTFGANVTTPPCMIEGQYGAQDENSVGNFELCVAVAGKVQHWWRDNAGGTMNWAQSVQPFGHDVERVVALVEGSYGFNLEIVVLRTDKQLQHYWRDGVGWHEGAVITGVLAGIGAGGAVAGTKGHGRPHR